MEVPEAQHEEIHHLHLQNACVGWAMLSLRGMQQEQTETQEVLSEHEETLFDREGD